MAKAPKVGEPNPLVVIEPTTSVVDETVSGPGEQIDTVEDVPNIAAGVVSEIAEGAGDMAEIVEEQTEGFASASAEQVHSAGDVNPLSVVAVLPLVFWAAIVASCLRTLHTFAPAQHPFGRQA